MSAEHQQKARKEPHACTRARTLAKINTYRRQASVPDRRSITVVRLALSLAQLHSLITHLSSGWDVDKTFKPLNPRCINMDNMHMVNVSILSWGAGVSFRCSRYFQPGVCAERQWKRLKLISLSAGGRSRKQRGEDGGWRDFRLQSKQLCQEEWDVFKGKKVDRRSRLQLWPFCCLFQMGCWMSPPAGTDENCCWGTRFLTSATTSRLQPMNGKHLWVEPPTSQGRGVWDGQGVRGQSSPQVCEGERGALHSWLAAG